MSGVVAYRLRADLRRRWRTFVWLTLLVAVLGGVVISAAAGARRTSSAYERLLSVSHPPDLLVSPPGGPGSDPRPFYEAVRRVPGVRGTALVAGIPMVPESGTPSERLAEELGGLGVVASVDGRWGSEIGRPRLLAGRYPDPTRADEVLVSERMAKLAHLEVGDRIDGVLLTEGETDVVGAVARPDQGTPIRLTVTGIGVRYDEVVPFSELDASGSILATAPLAALVDRESWNYEGVALDAEPGADLAELTAVIEGLGEADLGTGGPVFISDQTAAARQVGDSMRPLAVALAVAAIAIGLVTLLVVGQAVSRATRELPDEIDAVRAVGLRPADRLAFAAGRAAVVGTAGAIGAVAVALALSGRFPIGVARVAEPDPGVRADSAVLAIGAGVIVFLTIVCVVPSALLALRSSARLPRPSRLASAAAASGLPAPAVQGVRMAAVGGRSRPVPLRTTLLAVTVAITSVVATVIFADSLVSLIDTPARYGQGWDRMFDAQFGPIPVSRVLDRLDDADGVRGIAAGNYGDVVVNGIPVPAFDLESVRGQVSTTIVEGRSATGPEEIVLGGETLESVGGRVGDTVEVNPGDGSRRMRVVGAGVFPAMGQGSFSTTGLGVGAQLSGGVILSFSDVGEEMQPDYELDGRTYNFVVIDLDGAVSRLDHELAELEASAVDDGAFAFIRREQPPTKVRDLDRVRVVPAGMALVLAVMAVAALTHLLLTSVRERRRELALLRTLGFSRRQLRASIAWHASAITMTAVVVGTPLGIALGRAVWRWFAAGLHTSAPAETPWAWLALALLGTLVLANLVAAIPARRAARTQPALTLREE